MEARSRPLIAIAALFVVGFIAFSIWYALKDAVPPGSVAVEIIKAPADAAVTIDRKPVSGTTVHLMPGEHSYVISRSDFRSEAGTITVKPGATGEVIVGLLEPTSDIGREIYEKSSREYALGESRAGTAAEQRGEALQDKNPLVSLLPYSNYLFSIGYRADPDSDDDNAIIIEIDASPTYRDAAITQLTAWGYNPAEYKINFRGEENPFR